MAPKDWRNGPHSKRQTPTKYRVFLGVRLMSRVGHKNTTSLRGAARVIWEVVESSRLPIRPAGYQKSA